MHHALSLAGKKKVMIDLSSLLPALEAFSKGIIITPLSSIAGFTFLNEFVCWQ
jgi:hypothetical protein